MGFRRVFLTDEIPVPDNLEEFENKLAIELANWRNHINIEAFQYNFNIMTKAEDKSDQIIIKYLFERDLWRFFALSSFDISELLYIEFTDHWDRFFKVFENKVKT